MPADILWEEGTMHSKHIWLLMVLLLLALPAYGYTDPGSGLMLWQIMGAMFVGLMFYARKAVVAIWPGKGKGRNRNRCPR